MENKQMDDMFGGERFWQDGPDDNGDAEVDALWNGQLPMDRVLETLQKEIECRQAAENTSRAWEALAARGDAAILVLQDRIAELEKQLAEANERCADYALFATGVKNFFTEKNNE